MIRTRAIYTGTSGSNASSTTYSTGTTSITIYYSDITLSGFTNINKMIVYPLGGFLEENYAYQLISTTKLRLYAFRTTSGSYTKPNVAWCVAEFY